MTTRATRKAKAVERQDEAEGKETVISEVTDDAPDPAVVPAPAVSTLPVVATTADLDTRRAMPYRVIYPFGWSSWDLRRMLLLLLAGGAALYFLWLVQDILPPFIIAFFLAALLDPTLRAMEQRGRSRVWAIFMLYLLAFLSLFLVIFLIVPRAMEQLTDITQNFNGYFANVQKTADDFLDRNSRILTMLGIKEHSLSEITRKNSNSLPNFIQTALGGITGFLSGLASKAIWFIIIPIAGFFFMRDYPEIRARAIGLSPDPYHDRVDKVSQEIIEVFSAYLRGLVKICSLFGFAAFLLFLLFGVKYALLLGLLAGTFYAIPYAGQLLTAVVVGAVAYSMGPHGALLGIWQVGPNSVLYAVVVVLSNILMNNVFDQIVYPNVVGREVGLHPVTSIFALTAGATLFGIWGMLLAAPVAASLQIVLMYCFPKLKQEPPERLLEPPTPAAAA